MSTDDTDQIQPTPPSRIGRASFTSSRVTPAEQATISAQSAKSKSAGMFQQKQAIEALQVATVASSEALVSLAESQKHLFENQQALAHLIRPN